MSTPTYIYPPVTTNPGQLYDDFTAYMQAWIPGWKPYSGELDDWLARAFTVIGAQLMEIESDVATSIFRYFGAFILNYPPYAATSATGTVAITVIDNAGYTVPAYTSFSFRDASGNLQGFETLTDTVIAPGSTTAVITVQAMTPGSAGNGCSGSGDLDSSTPITFITGLSMAASSNGGNDAEEDSAYLDRLATLLTTLTTSPITATNFSTIAMTQEGVGRAFTLGAFNPANWTTTGTTTISSPTVTAIPSTANIPVGAPVSGTGIPAGAFVKSVDSSSQVTLSANATASGSGVTLTITGQLNQGGMVTGWLVDSNGNALSSGTLSTIQAAIQALCLTNVVYTALSPTYTAVSVTASVVAWNDPNNSTSAVQTAVQTALTTFLAPNTFGQLGKFVNSSAWLNETTVRVSALETVIMNVPGVHYVSSITINGVAADLPLGGVVPLPTAGTITVTVTTG